jgi:hypothetical protein
MSDRKISTSGVVDVERRSPEEEKAYFKANFKEVKEECRYESRLLQITEKDDETGKMKRMSW